MCKFNLKFDTIIAQEINSVPIGSSKTLETNGSVKNAQLSRGNAAIAKTAMTTRTIV